MASQDGLCATKRPNPDLHVPSGTLKIEPSLSFNSPQSTETEYGALHVGVETDFSIFQLATEYWNDNIRIGK